MHVLIVDDEEGIRSLVRFSLEAAGFECSEAASGAEALLKAQKADVLVLDWMLPDLSGVEVASTLRRNGHHAKVLILTARGDLEDRLAGLAVSADYVVKPFEVDELVARVKNLASLSSGAAEKRVTVGDLTVDRSLFTAFVKSTELPLTPTEFRLLDALVSAGGAVLSRHDAYDIVWGYDFGGSRANLDTLVSSLRKKLSSAGCEQLETVRGFGYRLSD